ncbi:efflux RND transporter permease subunit [Entomobacter blattae]|uniref:Efflux pump membrane transporter n=1 Tax=Entomobacter blattae TaxID=2762277 RepID=A0A7H1NQH1_9PROT|nr:efflux RND transporter permease subunit [Entomobacter blattae]QNT78031.1 Multidrug/solvent efflux pump membrane transporter MepB [Entomobacter blattae]
MSLSRFFIDRPIFAWVVALIISIIGVIQIISLPVAQWPLIAPPPITISATYPGATADTVQRTVVDPILQSVYGLDNLEYISAVANADGSSTITLTFAQGTNPDTAATQVLIRMNVANSLLPSVVALQGIRISKSNKSLSMVVSLSSEDNSMDEAALGDLMATDVQNPVTRLNGIGDYLLFSSEYAMRVWLDPDKMNNYQLNVGDVMQSIEAQNAEQPLGEFGKLPALPQTRTYALSSGIRRLMSPEQFQNILLKVKTNGATVHLSDIAKVELGPMQFQPLGMLNGHQIAPLGLKLSPTANQLAVANEVYDKMKDLSRYFPPHTKVEYPVDTSPFVVASMHEVVETLVIAVLLVVVVMYLFLQSWRATLVPSIAVPVVLLGTFAILGFAGFTINTLTMLAMVLAIGLLVDDAIVVVENVERVMEEDNLDAKEATRVSMDQISGALVGIAVVLSVVFIPMAFFSGSAGVVYRQFSITIVSAMILSVIIALIFSPALCATLLKPREEGKKPFWFFRKFNQGFEWMVSHYIRCVKVMMNHWVITLIAYLAICAVVALFYMRIPGGFMPDEDQGEFYIQTTLAPGASAAQVAAVNEQIMNYYLTQEKDSVELCFTAIGFNFGGQAQNAAFGAVHLKPFDERRGKQDSAEAVIARSRKFFSTIRGATIIPFLPPPVKDLGNATGFDLELEDRGHLGVQKMAEARRKLLRMASADKRLVAVRPNGLSDAPEYTFNIDRQKASAQGVSISDINTMLATIIGSNDAGLFNLRGRVKHVFVQGAPDSRMKPEQLLQKWYIRNGQGSMVPLSTFVTGHWTTGRLKVETYNGYSSYEIVGQGAAGISSGQAMKIMEEYVAKLGPGIGHEWTGMSYEEQKSAGQAWKLYAISIVIVLLSLAALYESWPIPFAVMMVVPLGILGATGLTILRGLSNDVYFQVGLLTTVGLSAKNAILIVEFAKEHYDSGKSLFESAWLAAHERIRPILMTSLAFVFGVLPLAIATGPGAASHVDMGTSLTGGVVSATVLALLFVPVFFIVVLRAFGVKPHPIQKEASKTTAGQAME